MLSYRSLEASSILQGSMILSSSGSFEKSQAKTGGEPNLHCLYSLLHTSLFFVGTEGNNTLTLLLPIPPPLWLAGGLDQCGATVHNYSLDGNQSPDECFWKPGTYWPCLSSQLNVL